MDLSSIFKKYESFSNYEGTDKDTGHCYIDLYTKLLDPIRETAKNVLEIGVFSGASCQAWSEYFPNATVYGLDINFSNLKFGKNNDKIKYIHTDATDHKCLNLLPNRFDFVLDDGSHTLLHQIASAKIFAPLLNENGLYICEDIHQDNMNELNKNFQTIAFENNLIYELHDLREIKNHYDDDIVAVLKKI
jgi:predicted O-methyltransferase YrrM